MDLITLAAAKAYTDKKVGNGGGFALPYVEITTAYPAEGQALVSDEESAALDKAFATGLPVKIRVLFFGDSYTTTFTPIDTQGSSMSFRMLFADMMGTKLVFSHIPNMANNWIMGEQSEE